MPDLVEQMYCSQQIIIPPNLPSILKKYAKAAIRTQPYDLLVWSSAYFRAICDGIPPPVKERIEYPPPISESGLSPGFLKVLINQIGKGDTVSKEILESRWKGVCLNLQYLDELICVGGFCDDVDWKKFIAVAAGSIESNLTRTMVLICELMTDEPEGGSASIQLELFIDLYRFLAQLDCGPIDFRKREVSETETVCPQITAEDHPVICDCRSEGPPQVTWEQALADLERIDSGFSVETMLVEQGNLFNVWPLIEEDVEETEGEEEISTMADSAYGVQVWDDTFGSSSFEMLYAGEERLMGEEDFKIQSGIGPDVIVLEPPDASNIDAEEYLDEDQTDSEMLKKPRESEEVEDMFAPKIDSLREILDDEYVGEQEGEEIDVVDQESSKESEEPVAEEEEEKEVVGDVIEDNIVTIIEPDADIHHLPTPVTSEISVLIEEQAEGETSADTYDPSQKLAEKQSLVDVRVIAEEPVVIEEEQEKEVQAHDPFWKHIPGIGPVVPEEIVEDLVAYLKVVASYQSNMVMPKNLRHFKCPPLEIIEN